MKIEDFIHRRHHHQHQYQHLTTATASTDAASSAIVISSSSSSPSSSSLSLSGTKRSFHSAINAPSSKKNHKNDETICSTKMSNENNSIINATQITTTTTTPRTPTTPIKNGLNGSSSSSAAFNNNNNNNTTCSSSSSSSSTSASSSLLSSSSIIATATACSSSSSSGTNIVAAVTDSRIHVSRANPIHSNSSSNQHLQQQQQNYHHHNTNSNNNNGTTISTSSGATTTTTTTAAAAMAVSSRHTSGSAISRIKVEPVDNNGGLDYSAFNNNNKSGGSGAGGVGGGGVGMDSEIVGRIQSNSSAAAIAAAGTASGDGGSSRSGLGGRLQFFKDGKFILELARAKEGEKSGWISVPRKQFRSPSTTSSTVTPTYPKNESSTSLSFSDDNSSIQSSPWQRDHCWKQTTPRRGISKEMSFYFKRTQQQTFVSTEGFKSARIKRRRPLDNSVCKTPFRVAKNGSSIAAEISELDDSKKVNIENDANDDKKKAIVRQDDDVDQTIAMEEEKSCSDDSSTEKEDSVRDSSKTPTPDGCGSDTVDGASSCSPQSVGHSESLDMQKQIQTTPTTKKTTKEQDNKRILNGEKRLKSRAKLSTIIQKLLDRLPTGLYHLSKTQIIGGTASQHQHSHHHHQHHQHHHHHHHQSHSSHQMPSTSSRLTSELHYHQQHVSPRKRILREFEKVSLEDSPVVNSKRSRAKGNVPTSGGGGGGTTMPLTPIPTGRGVAVSSSNMNTHYVQNGNRMEQSTATATAVIGANTTHNTANNNTTPTRLYSSYSIHSLLSGSSNSNSNKSTMSHQSQGAGASSGFNDPSYLRAMLASPKSPEGCTTNSKSSPYSSSSTTSGSAKKRSPPYSPLSEIHHQHQHPHNHHHHHQYQSRNRSPNVNDYGNMRSPPEAHTNRSYGSHTPSSSSSSRLTPPHGYLSSPKNSQSLASGGEGYKNSSPNHHFYSPYMMSPKYVPSPSAMSPNNSTSETYHPKLKGARSPSSSQQQNLRGGIFRTHSPHAITNHSGNNARESSPVGMLSSPSPNSSAGGMSTSNTTTTNTTPRTVPKKTVSIRRQFASPSSSSPSPGLSEHMKNSAANSHNSNNSKGDERTQAMSPITDPRRTPTQDSAAAAAAVAVSKYHQQAAAAAAMMQRSSPLGIGGGGGSGAGGSGGGGTPQSSLYYNMYPPPNGSPSPHHSSSSPSPSPSSSYIPQLNPYYHPYVSTLAALRNPLWMHHYPVAAAAAAAAAGAAAVMMPSSASSAGGPQMPGVPGVPFFPYNGAAAAAAAAAAGTQSAHPMHHHSAYGQMHLAAAGQLGLQPLPPPPPASMNRSPPTTTDDRISTSSIKEEHSSDVPLNLSKH